MPLGDLTRREYSFLSLLLLLSLLSSHYLHLAGQADTLKLVRSAVRSVRKVMVEISDWVEWLDDLATSLEVDNRREEEEEEEEGGTRMVIGLQDSSGKLVNATEELEYFASSSKPRRKHPAEASLYCLETFSTSSHQILFRVGEVVFHREYEVRGVVLGWDYEAKAPLSWLRQAELGCNIPKEIFSGAIIC